MQFPHGRSRQVYEELGKFDGGNEAKRLDWMEMYEFQAGNNYTGQSAKGVNCGYGVMSYRNGEIYEGY